MKILVTGANGFVGRALVEKLAKTNDVIALVRNTLDTKKHIDNLQVLVSDLDNSASYESSIKGVDVVVHCAARVHIMDDLSSDTEELYHKANVRNTDELLSACIQNGVKRFIFLSTIKVNGEETGKTGFQSSDEPNPSEPYACSKLLAEQLIQKKCLHEDIDFTVIRPPLVYGPGVKANFKSLINIVLKRYPLPFRSITNNLRSMVFVENLVNLIEVCTYNPHASNQVFLVSDDEAISFGQLVDEMASAADKKSLSFPMPISLIKLTGALLGKRESVRRFLSSLQVDIEHTKKTLQWQPPYSFKEGLRLTVRDALINRGKK